MTDAFPPIGELLPHAAPAILIDAVLEQRTDGVVARVRIDETHPFFDPQLGGVPVWVGIELMAQAVGAHAGLLGRQAGAPPRLGYLLGARRFTATVAAFPPQAELRVEVGCQYLEDSGLGAYDCRIFQASDEYARAVVTVFQPNNEANP